MTTAIAKYDPGSLVAPESRLEQIALIRRTYYGDLTDAEFQLMQTEAEYRDLDIVKKEFCGIVFGQGDRRRAAYFPTIAGIRKLAGKTGRILGTVSQWCGPDGNWRDVWLESTPPAAARCTLEVLGLGGSSGKFVGIATYQERRRTYYSQAKKEHVLMDQWRDQPAHMLAKCAEADAYRKSGLISDLGLPAEAFASLAFLSDGGSEAFEAEPITRAIANRHAHDMASRALGAGGDAHTLVRQTVQATKPDLASLREADVSDLESAAELLDTFGAAAPIVATGESVDVEYDQDGNVISAMTPLEEFRIMARELIEAEGGEGVKKVYDVAGEDLDAWRVLITDPKISSLNLARKMRDEFIRRNTKGSRVPPAILEVANEMLAARENIERSQIAHGAQTIAAINGAQAGSGGGDAIAGN